MKKNENKGNEKISRRKKKKDLIVCCYLEETWRLFSWRRAVTDGLVGKCLRNGFGRG